jgi:hypothetical protein
MNRDLLPAVPMMNQNGKRNEMTMTGVNGYRQEITSLTSGDTEPAAVIVVLADGSEEKRQLTVHPLAQMIPLITPADLDRLRDDIEAVGVNEPLVMFEGQVLDGRNRLAVASVTGIPVRLRDFDGDEDAAKAYVWSLNAARRHLSPPQLALAASRFGFIADAKAQPGARDPGPRGGPAPWAHAVSKRLGGAVSPQTLERFDRARVTEAPDTVADIESGQIRRVDVAVKSAAAERSLAEGHPVDVPPPIARTPWDRLGCARGDVLAAEQAVITGSTGAMTAEQFAARAREIQGALIRIQSLYRYGKGG